MLLGTIASKNSAFQLLTTRLFVEALQAEGNFVDQTSIYELVSSMEMEPYLHQTGSFNGLGKQAGRKVMIVLPTASW